MLFCSDLDRTLIWRNHPALGTDKICVERKEGKELSFMSTRSVELLGRVLLCTNFVPITSRSLKQYRRVEDGIGCPSYALVSNGAILLHDGSIDQYWYERSRQLIRPVVTELDYVRTLIDMDSDTITKTSVVDGFYLFAVSKDVKRLANNLRLKVSDNVEVITQGKKLYIIPKVLSKGNAIKRFHKMFGKEYTVAAGDSVMDLSMFSEVDKMYVPEGVERGIQLPNFFTETLLQEVLKEVE